MHDPQLRVTVAVAVATAPRSVQVSERKLPDGATVADALTDCGLPQALSLVEAGSFGIAIWGRRATLAQPLADGDRIELCRPLLVDPKTARRERFARQGRRASGLFAASDARGVRS